MRTAARNRDPRRGPIEWASRVGRSRGPGPLVCLDEDMSAGHDNHGSTPAAWTVVTLITIAFFIATLALVLGNWVLFWIGVAVLPLSLVVGKIMQAMGLGAKPRS